MLSLDIACAATKTRAPLVAPRSLILLLACALAGCSAKTTTGQEVTLPARTPDVDASAQSPQTTRQYRSTAAKWTALLDKDTSFEMRGTGWHCFDVTMISAQGPLVVSSCTREKKSCEAFRQGEARLDQTTPCKHHERAFCLRARHREERTDFSLCSTANTECQRKREVLRGKPAQYEFVTECEELD